MRFDPSLLLVYPNQTTNVTFDLELSISEEESGDGFVGSPSSMTKPVLVELQNSNGKTVSEQCLRQCVRQYLYVNDFVCVHICMALSVLISSMIFLS